MAIIFTWRWREAARMFRREVKRSERDPDVLVDSKLGDAAYVDSFGQEWQSFDGFTGKEIMSHGHLFGRFMLPRDFFAGRDVVDVGCGNGRIGRLIAPHCGSYTGVDLSEALYAFPKYAKRPGKFGLVRASATDLPLEDACADVVVCWGVLHHVNEPRVAFSELVRITRPRGTILLYVYPRSLDLRKNLNTYLRGLPLRRGWEIIDRLSDEIDAWHEVDPFFAAQLANYVSMSFKQSKSWQKFQWYDGVTPRYHWSLEPVIPELAERFGLQATAHRPGCFTLRRHEV
jgi:SAM-dependent methyltransferase